WGHQHESPRPCRGLSLLCCRAPPPWGIGWSAFEGMGSRLSNSIGTADSRFIIIRGNSGSGKSILAQAIRSARPRGVAILGHDPLRREILHVSDRPGALSVDYIDMSARFALDNGLHV